MLHKFWVALLVSPHETVTGDICLVTIVINNSASRSYLRQFYYYVGNLHRFFSNTETYY